MAHQQQQSLLSEGDFDSVGIRNRLLQRCLLTYTSQFVLSQRPLLKIHEHLRLE